MNVAEPCGFDSPVASRKEDYLNRWPVAREIFGIATTGPKDWSVRIGVYGEWGTGKTSVLRFISSMAEEAGHIAISFNPWQHSSKDSLWRDFVLCIFGDRRLERIPGARKARAKGFFGNILKRASIIESGTAILNEKAGKGVGAGLELVKSFFSFSQQDLKTVQEVLGEKRVIVLIDDLDRTAPELVPEILFALKELMDIPGFSFVCAFDPIVVGKVLGRYHPGFGEGLKFLDKIIDYPRWLPPASTEALTNLAVAEATRSCHYVPQTAIRDSLSLLPKNPRAVRQFIRLLALLKPHIERHNNSELDWPVILKANILKIRHPRLAHELLNAPTFWDSIGTTRLMARGQDEENALGNAVSQHIEKTCADLGIPPLQPEGPEMKELKSVLKAICSQAGLFSGLDEQGVAYQVNVAEAPPAVTWKEFDVFLTAWKPNQTADTARQWIADHARRVDHAELEVYRDLLNAAIRRYDKLLNQAEDVLAEPERPPILVEANSLLALLNALIFDLGQLDQPAKQIGDAEVDLLFERWARFAGSRLQVHKGFWPRNEALILGLFEKWSPDVMSLIRILRHGSRDFDGGAAQGLHERLCAVALPKFARQIIARFREPGFVEGLIYNEEEDTFDVRSVLWDANGPLWGPLRQEFFQFLNEAPSNRSIQWNAYELLHWFAMRAEGHGPGDIKAMRTLLSDQKVFDALWKAAIAIPIAHRGVYQLKHLPRWLKVLGIEFSPPAWWQEIMSTIFIPASPTSPDGAGEPEQSTENAPGHSDSNS